MISYSICLYTLFIQICACLFLKGSNNHSNSCIKYQKLHTCGTYDRGTDRFLHLREPTASVEIEVGGGSEPPLICGIPDFHKQPNIGILLGGGISIYFPHCFPNILLSEFRPHHVTILS